ncbi:MAG TPA: neutral zinc metallopeptidase [Candidatus Eisenbacteria bacterium]|nr:neutral zinc metallopeptidase [Candidatus Eisenbacteria bacterium]
MRWKNERRSTNVEDRRGRIPGGGLALGGGLGIVVLVVALLMGADPRQLLDQLQTSTETTAAPEARSPKEDELADFVSVVLAETEDVWSERFRADGREYSAPTLVLFTDRVESACGMAGTAMGPFYCPGDSKIYIDLGFYDLLRDRLGAPGDFAQAYVIAHEVGHHVQNLLGISERVERMRGRMSEEEFNRMSVRLELQADFLAGVWAHHTQKMKQVIEAGDIEEAIDAAGAVGDDRLQRETRGAVVPDSFTHGTSAQRVRWFRLGYETGDMRQGDTFAAERL